MPKWRRFRLIVTIIMSAIGAGLLLLAYALLGRFPGATVVTLAFFALVLPVGFYLVFTVVGWQRSVGSGVTPNAVIGWLIRSHIAPFVPIMFMFFLLGLMGQLGMAVDSGSSTRADSAGRQAFRDACISGARQEVGRTGGNPDAADMKAKVASYCGCLITRLEQDYTPEEFVKLASDPGTMDKDAKMSRIIDRCAAESPK